MARGVELPRDAHGRVHWTIPNDPLLGAWWTGDRGVTWTERMLIDGALVDVPAAAAYLIRPVGAQVDAAWAQYWKDNPEHDRARLAADWQTAGWRAVGGPPPDNLTEPEPVRSAREKADEDD